MANCKFFFSLNKVLKLHMQKNWQIKCSKIVSHSENCKYTCFGDNSRSKNKGLKLT